MLDQVVISLFLALQGMIALAALEVTIRYGRWYVATARNEQLLLRALILGVALANLAIFSENASWMYERFVNHVTMNTTMEGAMSAYYRATAVKGLMWLGVTVHLIPIWRIVNRFTWWEVLLAILARAGIASTAYVGGLWAAGLLGCYLTPGCY